MGKLLAKSERTSQGKGVKRRAEISLGPRILDSSLSETFDVNAVFIKKPPLL